MSSDVEVYRSGEVVLSESELRVVPGLVYFGPRVGGMKGFQAIWHFENDWGVSMIVGDGSYAIEMMTMVWDADTPRGDSAVLDFERYAKERGVLLPGETAETGYDGQPFIKPVRGWLTKDSALALLGHVQSLPNAHETHQELESDRHEKQ